MVSGMRTQLTLGRQQTTEKINTIHKLIEENAQLKRELDQMRRNCQYWLEQSNSRLAFLRAAVDYAATGKCESPNGEAMCATMLDALKLAVDRKTKKAKK